MPDGGHRIQTASGGKWSIGAEAVAAENTCTGPAEESQASNDKQIRPGSMEMEPADVFTVCFQK